MSIGRIIGVLGYVRGMLYPAKVQFVEDVYSEFVKGEISKITWRQLDQLQIIAGQRLKDEKLLDSLDAIKSLFDIAEKTMPDEDVKAICNKEYKIIDVMYKVLYKEKLIPQSEADEKFLKGCDADLARCSGRDFLGVKSGIVYGKWEIVKSIKNKITDPRKKALVERWMAERDALKKNYRKKLSEAKK